MDNSEKILAELDRSIFLAIHSDVLYRYDKNIVDAWKRGQQRFVEGKKQ